MIVLLTLLGCQEHEILNNIKIVDHIDSLDCTKQKLTIKIDEAGKLLDTIQISEIKENKNGVKLFQKNINDNGETISEIYFWEEDSEPFLTITNNDKIDLHVTVELFKNSKGDIAELLVTESSNGKIDSFTSNYIRTHNIFGKLRTIETTSAEEIKSFSIFDKGKVVLDLIIMENDTTKRTEYKYSDDKLESSESYSYLGDSTISVSKYIDTKLSSTQFYEIENSRSILQSAVIYHYDEQSKLSSYISTDYETNKTDSIIIKYQPCD